MSDFWCCSVFYVRIFWVFCRLKTNNFTTWDSEAFKYCGQTQLADLGVFVSANHRYAETFSHSLGLDTKPLGQGQENTFIGDLWPPGQVFYTKTWYLLGKCDDISSENPAETQSWRHKRDWKCPEVSSEISNFVASDTTGKWLLFDSSPQEYMSGNIFKKYTNDVQDQLKRSCGFFHSDVIAGGLLDLLEFKS